MEWIILGIINIILGLLTVLIIIKTEGKDGHKMSYIEAFFVILLGIPLFLLAIIGLSIKTKINK
jgi:nitrogen fixation/metabolism regulation signal transduction histidine kinase